MVWSCARDSIYLVDKDGNDHEGWKQIFFVLNPVVIGALELLALIAWFWVTHILTTHGHASYRNYAMWPYTLGALVLVPAVLVIVAIVSVIVLVVKAIIGVITAVTISLTPTSLRDWRAKRRQRIDEAFEARRKELWAQLEAMTCEGPGKIEEVSLEALPPEKQTFKLRYWRLKSKHCRPYTAQLSTSVRAGSS